MGLTRFGVEERDRVRRMRGDGWHVREIAEHLEVSRERVEAYLDPCWGPLAALMARAPGPTVKPKERA